MTKKDYILIAAALASVRPRTSARLHVWKDTVESIASALLRDNLRFDHVRFVEACNGVTVSARAVTASAPTKLRRNFGREVSPRMPRLE